jgi:hypothetical protein
MVYCCIVHFTRRPREEAEEELLMRHSGDADSRVFWTFNEPMDN